MRLIKMRLIKKTLAVLLFVTFSLFSTRAFADEAMKHTLRSSLYGGVIGAIVGSAIVLLTDDHLEYIPTGAALGVLAGAAYGLATGEFIYDRSAIVVEDGKFALRLPTIKSARVFDKNANDYNLIESVDLLRVKF